MFRQYTFGRRTVSHGIYLARLSLGLYKITVYPVVTDLSYRCPFSSRQRKYHVAKCLVNDVLTAFLELGVFLSYRKAVCVVPEDSAYFSAVP